MNEHSLGQGKYALLLLYHCFQLDSMHQVSYNLRNSNVYFILLYRINAFRQITGKAN